MSLRKDIMKKRTNWPGAAKSIAESIAAVAIMFIIAKCVSGTL